MKFAAFAVITAAVAGVGAVPVESGPLAHLQARASDAIGGVVSFIRREEAGQPVLPPQLKRTPPPPPVRFHNAREVDFLRRRKDGDGKNNPVPPLKPFSKGSRDEQQPAPVLEARKKKEEEVPPLAPFSKGGGSGKREEVPADLTSRKAPQESVPPLAPFSAKVQEEEEDEE